MSGQHTPGPWGLREDAPAWEVFGDNRTRWVAYAPKVIANELREGTFYPTLAETAANAHLIAAAPELLEALITIAGPPERDPDLPPIYEPRWSAEQCRDIARAAINKAFGK